MALSLRLGLCGLAESGDVLAARDWNQQAKALAAARTALALLLGGEGLYLGLATAPTDQVAASAGEPLLMAVADDSGYIFWFHLTAAAAIDFVASDGALNLYAQIAQELGVSPALAGGGIHDVRFVANTAAPPHSLLLGGGTVVDSAFITWTEAPDVRVDGGPVFARGLADADADTRVRVETEADDDVIRFAVAGDERLTLSTTLLDAAVPVRLGGASTDAVTCVGRLITRDLASSNPSADRAGGTGEIAHSSTTQKAYLCATGGDAGSAVWVALN